MRHTLIYLLLFSLFPLLSPPGTASAGSQSDVIVIRINGVINPASAEHINRSIKKAHDVKAEVLVIELDTPGGLDSSMRSIIKEIVNSEIPVIVFVSPGGARAASAGVFITMSAHVAAMAHGTNIGAAHPVSIGEKMDKTVAEKATNDAAAYIKSLAEAKGRNAKWAEQAVRKSVSITETEALAENVIDIVTKDLNSLLAEVENKKVRTVLDTKTLKTKNARIVREEMGFRHKVLNFISDPNVAYVLMLLGFYGLFFELTNPGAIFPGVIGGICLILAFYAFQTLPVNYAGLLLIILAIVMFILEVKIISHGVLTLGGITAMVIGSLMLFESPGPFLKLSLYLILPAVIITALFFMLTIGLAFRAYKKKPVTGAEGLTGEEGIAHNDISKQGGTVSVHGEIWSAYSDEEIKKNERVRVERVSGLKVKVRKI